MKRAFLFVALSIGLNACFLFGGDVKPKPVVKDSVAAFNDSPVSFLPTTEALNEVSGIAASQKNPGYVWLIEDSEAQAGVHLMTEKGVYQKFFAISGNNRDWEDLAVGPGPKAGVSYIYAPDIGDNLKAFKEYKIYRFEEPSITASNVNNPDVIRFQYPNSASYDSETIMVDPKTKDIYIVTKGEFNEFVFRLAYPQALDKITEAELLGKIPFWGITSGDISYDGKEILLKTYIAVFYWRPRSGESVFQALSRARDIGAPYVQEHQGESICWDAGAKGYFTMSERGGQPDAPKLFYYSKK